MSALLTTISHWPLVTIGFSTGVSGDANAGTCSMRRTRFRHDVLPLVCTELAFSDGHTTDGGLNVDVGDAGPSTEDVRTSGGADDASPITVLSGASSVDAESCNPLPRRYIATLRGPHFCCSMPRNLPIGPRGTSRWPSGRVARACFSTSDAKCTPRCCSFSGSTGDACGSTGLDVKVGVVGEGREAAVESERWCRSGRGGSPSKSNASIRWCSAAQYACDSTSWVHNDLQRGGCQFQFPIVKIKTLSGVCMRDTGTLTRLRRPTGTGG